MAKDAVSSILAFVIQDVLAGLQDVGCVCDQKNTRHYYAKKKQGSLKTMSLYGKSLKKNFGIAFAPEVLRAQFAL
ncbi:MAG: hypothetical protein ACOH5I_09480 [Oligoflexus sp.]